MMNDDKAAVRGFMDGIDWQHHLGFDAHGTPIYSSMESCRRGRPCMETGGCGMVEVEVRFVRWVEIQNLTGYPTPPTNSNKEAP